MTGVPHPPGPDDIDDGEGRVDTCSWCEGEFPAEQLVRGQCGPCERDLVEDEMS